MLDIQSLDFYQTVERAADAKVLLELLAAFARQLNAHAGCALACQANRSSSWRINTFGDLPACFADAVLDTHTRVHDPLWQHCVDSMMPTIWDRSTYEQAGLQEELAHMADAAIGCGIASPMRASERLLAALLWWPQPESVRSANLHEAIPLISLMTRYLDSAAYRLGLYPAPNPLSEDLASLTPRELEVLTWVAHGKTEWEIGKILSLSEHTVSDHMESAARRLSCRTRMQAVVKAYRAGLLF